MDFFTTFFKEKDLVEKTYEVEINGTWHLIPTSIVIQQIKAASGADKKKIEMVLRKLDFLNGDIHHFLKHLAVGIAANFEGANNAS